MTDVESQTQQEDTKCLATVSGGCDTVPVGSSDKEIISAYTYLFSEKESYSHPNSYDRIGIVITGLHAATKQCPSKEHVDAIIGKIKAGLIKTQ